MNTPSKITYVGIDVSKASLDVFHPQWTAPRRFSNDASSFESLWRELRSSSDPIHLILEATGGYERPLRRAAQSAQRPLSLVNPRQARDFAKASGQLAKTDPIDARTLARFGECLRPEPSPLPAASSQKLQAAVRRRAALVEASVREQALLDTVDDPYVRRDIRSSLTALKRRIAKFDAQIEKLIAKDPQLQAKRTRLEQIKGVGLTLSATLLAELPERGEIADRPLASLCGLAPFNRDSGVHQGQRSTWGGRGRIRRALYMPTLCAIRYNPPLNELSQRLIAKGKPAKVAITAAMRRLICVLNRMLADPDFQPR